MKNIHIKVEDGGIFEGNFGHWQDTFYSFPDCFKTLDRIDSIKTYCKENGWKVEIERTEDGCNESFSVGDWLIGSFIIGFGCTTHYAVFYAVVHTVGKYT